jgi:hypothetical protein
MSRLALWSPFGEVERAVQRADVDTGLQAVARLRQLTEQLEADQIASADRTRDHRRALPTGDLQVEQELSGASHTAQVPRRLELHDCAISRSVSPEPRLECERCSPAPSSVAPACTLPS